MHRSVVRLYVQYPAFGRISIVDYNQLTPIQQVTYAATVSTVYSIAQWCLNRPFDCMCTTLHWVECTLLHIINSNLINTSAMQSSTVSTVYSITQWCIHRASDCVFNTLHWVEYTLLPIINSDLSNRPATQLLWVQFTPSLSDASIGRLIVCALPCIG